MTQIVLLSSYQKGYGQSNRSVTWMTSKPERWLPMPFYEHIGIPYALYNFTTAGSMHTYAKNCAIDCAPDYSQWLKKVMLDSAFTLNHVNMKWP